MVDIDVKVNLEIILICLENIEKSNDIRINKPIIRTLKDEINNLLLWGI